ncbi:nephrocystin-3-like isoform X2 [Lineus longissimus]|uniref:nephrocystin-3-like isoform X2 n=1 Tax=Lineus longissimus TaxID=88925 RepID=UPI00315D05FE
MAVKQKLKDPNRYGWCGVNDDALQENFNVALPHFPWLDKFRDKGVTELEFLHGFLNNPGERPACVCFRDKSWDDKLKAQAEAKGDARGAAKYTSENEHAVFMMNDLKKRVVEVEEKCLAVDMSYCTPEEGAKFMFNAIWKYMSEELLVDPSGIDLEPSQQQKLQHDAFCDSHCGLFIGGNDYMNILDVAVHDEESKGIVVFGEPGVGKSALLSNWIKQKKEDKDFGFVGSHFIGFPDQSTDIKNIVNRMSQLLSLQYHKDGDDEFQLKDEVATAVGQFKTMLDSAAERVDPGKNICLVIDGLEKVEDKRKVGKPLYWIPSTLPPSVSVIVATVSTDVSTIQELVEARGYSTCKIEGLNMEDKKKMCLGVLQSNSKDLPGDQMDMIVAPEQTKNPLYLKVVMQELCVVDYYRKIKGKIEYLLTSDNIQSLFDKLLERLEQDYNTSDHPHIVQDVACSLFACHYGLSEEELIESLDIPSNIWIPLHFALNLFLLQHSGLLCFAYSELREAVHDRYLKSVETHERYTRQILWYFLMKYNQSRGESLNSLPMQHVVRELTWLLSEVKDSKVLGDVLTDLRVFKHLYSYDRYMVLEYWQSTMIPGDKIAVGYVKAMKQAVVDTYVEQLDGYEELNPAWTVYKEYADQLLALIDGLASFKGREILLYYYQDVLRKVKLDRIEKEDLLLGNHYRLAVLYTDMHKNKEAEELFTSLLKKYERKSISTDEQRLSLGDLYHLVGVFYMNAKKWIEANEWFGKAHAIYRKMTGLILAKGVLLNNLGVVNLELANYESAEECFEISLKLYEQYYFGELPPDIGMAMQNLALCHRRQGKNDQAKTTYEKCLKITKEALGLNHPHVAKIYLNQGMLANIAEDFGESERLYRLAFDIFKGLYPADHADVIIAQENVAQALLSQGRWEEAEELFWDAFSVLVKQDRIQHGLPHMQAMFADHYYHLGCNNTDGKQQRDQLEMARTILIKHLPYTKYPLMYHRLSHIDLILPPDNPREPHLTLDAGIERFPDSELLVETKFKSGIAETGSLDEVLAFATKIQDHFPAPKILLQFMVWLEDMRCHDLGMELAKHVLTLVPADSLYERCVTEFEDEKLQKLLQPIINTLSNLKDYTNVFPFAQKLAELLPDDIQIQMSWFKSAVLVMKFDVARKAISHMTEHWVDDEQVQKDMINFTKAVDWSEEEMKKEQSESNEETEVVEPTI